MFGMTEDMVFAAAPTKSAAMRLRTPDQAVPREVVVGDRVPGVGRVTAITVRGGDGWCKPTTA